MAPGAPTARTRRAHAARTLPRAPPQLYLFFLSLYILDLFCLAAGVLRPFRCVRGVLLLLRNRTLRRMCAAIFGIRVVLGRATVFLLLILCLIAAAASHLFRTAYHATTTDVTSAFGPIYGGAFDTLPRGFEQVVIIYSSCTNHAVIVR